MKKIVIILLLLPLLLFTQESTQKESQEIQKTITSNDKLIAQFAQLAPMAINPYCTVFLTSLCAKIGFKNDFVATNSFLNSWVVLVLFGLLFVFTGLIGTVFNTNKVSAPIALADKYLSDHAAIIINGFIMLAPTLLSKSPIDSEIVYQAGFLSIDFKTILVLFTSIYFLIIVMTVRFSIDILIFLSPIPLIDTILDISKIVITTIFVFISIASPKASLIISVIMFLVALIFYRRSIRLVAKTKYLIIYPILNIFRKKKRIMTDGDSFSILVYTGKKTSKIKKGKIVRLEQQGDKFLLVRKRFLLPNIKEEIAFEYCSLFQNHFNIHLTNETGDLLLILNRSYHSYIDDLAKTLDIEITKRTELKMNINGNFMKTLKNMFNKKDITELKSI